MLFHLWRYEWKRMLRHPGLFLFVVIFPILLVGAIGLFLYSFAEEELDSVTILVLDEDKTFETNMLIQQLQNDDTIDGDVNFENGEKPLSVYHKNPDNYAAVIQIPEGFTDKLISGVNETITVYLNDGMPLASNLAYLLMESGQDYITAAQTGVNTVNHFHIKSINDSDERSRFLQQSIVHFTAFALNRNALFNEEASTSDDVVSFENQIYMLVMVVLIWMTYILLTIIFQPKYAHLIQERLQLISVKRIHRLLAELFHHITFMAIYIAFITVGLYVSVDSIIELNWMVYIQWLIIGMWLSLIYFMIHYVLKNIWLTQVGFILTSATLLLLGGLLIPPMYLSDTFQGLMVVYDGFTDIWSGKSLPWQLWLTLVGIWLILVIVWFAVGKVGRHANHR
ncbi:ABC transporter permease [Aquisalibacillus elongatus]|uniref:ABC-2 family transporter n=1 Tax=Aquisalibacillus elongatus TaxID=485577 RepID=A0A3N5B3K2_9BACI|nr:ABC transporter permease [Aquisalibacillus elongatus]RPF50130.1 ABC-2 family transporter [Aquisalibacillus elongatus]